MTNAAGSSTSAETLGVVDPMRIPGSGFVGRAWGRLPLLGRVFVGLTLLDIIAQTLQLGGLGEPLDVFLPMGIVNQYVPHDLLILLPAVILARRPDAMRATPLIVRGAILLALAELLRAPIVLLLGSADTFAAFAPQAVVHVAANVVVASGYVAIAMGLAALARSAPSRPVATMANLVGGLIAAEALTSLVGLFAAPRTDVGDAGTNALILVSSAASQIPILALAVLARAVARGSGDPGRPAAAVYTASIAMVLAALASALVVFVNLVAITQVVTGQPLNPLLGSASFGWLGSGFVLSALVIAFGLGLADADLPGEQARLRVEPS